MAHNERNPRYPSPDTAQVGEGTGPFYSQQQRAPAQEDLEIQEHLSRDMAPNSDHMAHDGQTLQRLDQRFSQQMHVSHMQGYHALTAAQIAPQAMAASQMAPVPAQHVHVNAANSKGDEGSARKKTKVSRACDECRRKKIRCDAESDAPGHARCSNCSRTSTGCDFTRQPMKRGPSKGYIKELADRVESMERKIITQHVGGQSSTTGVNDFAMNHDHTQGHKRTHSMSENLSPQAYVQAQVQKPSEEYPNGGWPANSDEVDEPRRASQPYLGGLSQAPTANMSDIQDTTAVNGITDEDAAMGIYVAWKEHVMEEYFRVLHPTLPLLGNNVGNIRTMLRPVLDMRNGFFVALSMIVGRLSRTPLHPDTPVGAKATAALSTLFNTNAVNQMNDDTAAKLLPYLQAYIMIVAALDMNRLSSNQYPGLPSRDLWFDMAKNLAQRLKLHQDRVTALDIISVQRRRAYRTLIILDRFHAVSTATTSSFDDYATLTWPRDPVALGEQFIHISRLSGLLVGVLPLVLHPTPFLGTSDNIPVMVATRLLTATLSTYEETAAPLLAQYPLLKATYLYTKIYTARALANIPMPERFDLMDLTSELCRHLNSDQYMRNPLTHHFVALAGRTAVDLTMELAGYPALKAKAQAAIAELCHAINDRGIMGPDNEHGWKSILYQKLQGTLDRLEADPAQGANLQHMTIIAQIINSGEGKAATRVEDWAEALQEGYVVGWE